MGMSDLYGKADRAESNATIHAALDAGIDLIDAGDFYGSGLLALTGWRDL
jgi:pyridoxine 4-dehydrogenase